ncbi:PdaC/SigV domain-containing protein [Tissierella sp.]|uniref:PdaC/SigV domain-containing protein n=1 Tax=Tissierella sp. TaxID=41274 RepID=UPI002858A13F|nr:DUF3298 domain-containing protein [Tissierella sp.]MDR7856528.1 DUF3298 domain-containing protein [Tissierella sp.]
MKKSISFLLLLIICVSIFSFVVAEDDYTVKNSTITETGDFLSINISVPYFDGFKGADKVNKEIEVLVKNSIEDIRATATLMKEYHEENLDSSAVFWTQKAILDISYDYFLNKDLLSLQLNFSSYSGGAHGMYYVIPINVNTFTGEIYEFKDLFKSNSSVEVIEKKIIETMDKSPNNYFEDYDKVVKDKNGDFLFYIDGDKIVVYFTLYEIAPYAGGMHRFVFEGNELKELLKDEIYNSMKEEKSLDAIRFNGLSLSAQEVVLDDYVPMIPLRVVAESLGYKVDWNKKDGPTVAGKPLNDIEYKTIKGTSYVPMEYFTELLKENVSFGTSQYINTNNKNYDLIDSTIIRIFKETN